MKNPHWQYYISLMKDIGQLSQYIELTKENYQTFSIELVRLLLATGSEIDVVAKLLCEKVEAGVKCNNINEYRDVLMRSAPNISSVDISINRYSLVFTPWASWTESKNPEWWKSYNQVKHHRSHEYQEANLENCLNALAGLCVLLSYLYYDEVIKKGLNINTPMMFLSPKYKSGGKALFSPSYKLPDFNEQG